MSILTAVMPRLVLQAKKEVPNLPAIESEDHMTEEGVKSSTEMTQPVIIDLGKRRASTLKELKKGENENRIF